MRKRLRFKKATGFARVDFGRPLAGGGRPAPTGNAGRAGSKGPAEREEPFPGPSPSLPVDLSPDPGRAPVPEAGPRGGMREAGRKPD
ncbi:MAG TPA: hypothetical protein VIK99_10840 [Thermaerobacter sp.]